MKGKWMHLVFRGGSTLDVPLAKDAEVKVERNALQGQFMSVRWGETADSVQLLQFEPTELAAVLVVQE